MSKNLPHKTTSVLVPDWGVPAHVLACTTLRKPVTADDAFSGFNLATHVGDAPNQVLENREILKQALALPSDPLWLNQVHSNTAIEIGDYETGDKAPEADAVFTLLDDNVCAVLTADCLPILVTDTQGKGVAAIHAGWRGLASGIIKNTIEKFCSRLNIDVNESVVWLGPAISQAHFEVGEEVYRCFTAKTQNADTAFTQTENQKYKQKYNCDLYHLARLELNALGVKKITGGDHCTYTQEQDFYSHRRHTHQLNEQVATQQNCGRMATLIWLSGNNRN